MTDILQANIFFFIASVGVVTLTILVCVLVYQLIKITKSIRRIVDRVEAGSEVLADDIENLRENFNPARLISFVMSLLPGAKPKAAHRRKRSEEE